jgi:hypothetical protein
VPPTATPEEIVKDEAPKEMVLTFLHAALQEHEIVNVALHREYSPGIVSIFFQGRKDLYHV